jgi:hypothetical protein
MTKIYLTILFVLLFSINVDASDPCSTTKFHFPVIEQACKAGGRKEAKEVMKSIVKMAKGAGKDIKCTSCHEDMRDFRLKDNAIVDLRAFL